MANTAIASSLAKKARGTSTTDSSGTCTNRRSGENKYSDNMLSTEGRVGPIQLICHKGE